MTGKMGIMILLTLVGARVDSQHLIGLSQNEVTKKMQETSFVIDNTSRNTTFNYLKYVDRIEERTLLIFISKDGICTSTKLISDYSSFKRTLSDFNKKYKRISSKEWNYKVDGITYRVTLKKEEWFYSVIVTTKIKKLWKLQNY